MKKHLIQLAILVVATGMAVKSQAASQIYNITFTGTGLSASGQINVDVVNNTATSGFLDVTYGATTINYNYLAVGSGLVEDNNGDDLSYTDNVFPNSIPFTDANGLLFLTSPVNGNYTAGGGIYLSIDQYSQANPVPYNLNGYGNPPAGFGYNNPNQDGTATIAAVPEPKTTTMIGLSALGMLFVAFRKKFFMA